MISDPMDDNYKFARKFEMGCLQESVIELLNKNFVCRKIDLPFEADLKLEKNQARIEVWSPTNVKVGALTLKNDDVLNKGPFTDFLKSKAAKSGKLVKEEIARIEKARKEAAEKAKKETAAKPE